MRRNRTIACLVGAVGLICHPAHAEDVKLTVSTGLDYSTGRYGGTAKTTTVAIPLILKAEFQSLTLRLSLPYVDTSGPGNVRGVGGDRVVIGDDGARTNNRDIGDTVLGGTYTLYASPDWLVDVGGKIKFATGDDNKNLGTGKNDYLIHTDVYRLFGRNSVFGTFGYRRQGDPSGVDFRNPFYGSAGFSVRVTDAVSAGMSFDYRQSLTAAGEPIREATLFGSYRFSPEWKLQGYVMTGFSDASPDLGSGLILGRSF